MRQLSASKKTQLKQAIMWLHAEGVFSDERTACLIHRLNLKGA